MELYEDMLLTNFAFFNGTSTLTGNKHTAPENHTSGQAIKLRTLQ